MLKPIGKRLIIDVYEGAEKTEGGLELSNTQSNNAPVRGTVVRTRLDSDFVEGDIIYFRRFALDELKFTTETGEQTVYAIDEMDIIAVEEKSFIAKPTAREEKVKKNKNERKASRN